MTAGNDLIKGDSGNDTINAGAGSDSIDAGEGNDTLTLRVNWGEKDSVSGGIGIDSLTIDFSDNYGTPNLLEWLQRRRNAYLITSHF